MDHDKNATLKHIVDFFWKQGQRQKEPAHFEVLDKWLEELAQDPDLNPKDIAYQVKSLLDERATLQRRSPVWKYVGLVGISVILSIGLMSLLAFLYLHNDAPTSPSVPSRIEISSKPSSPFLADGSAEIPIEFTVFDQYSKTFSGPVFVEFFLYPPTAGQVEPQRVLVNSEGKAETIFRSGNVPGEVKITARVDPYPQQVLTLTLVEAKQPNLTVNRVTEKDYLVRRGEVITFTFSITNTGNAVAEDIELLIDIPDRIIPHQMTRETGADITSNTVAWKMGNLDPGANAKRNLVAIVGHNLIDGDNLLILGYKVQYKNSPSLTGQTEVHIDISGIVLGALKLSIEPSELAADGMSEANVTAKVLDQYGSPINNKIPITFTWQFQDSEEVLTNTMVATAGVANFPFTGTVAGNVLFTAEADGYSDTAILDLFKRTTVKTITNLCPEANITDRLIVYQLPAGTHVELLGTVKEGYQKVSLLIWIPADVISTTQDSHQSFIVMEDYQEVRLGETPDVPSGGTLLYKAANGIPVQILDDTKEDYVRVRIEGWIITTDLSEH